MESNFIETVFDNFLFQNISDFTFLRKEKPISTLDLIFTDSDSLIDYIELRPPLAALENGHLCIDFGIGIGEKNQATNYISGRKLAYQRAECHKIESELLLCLKAAFLSRCKILAGSPINAYSPSTFRFMTLMIDKCAIRQLTCALTIVDFF